MDREKNDDYKKTPPGELYEDQQEVLYLDPAGAADEDAESTGGLDQQTRQRSLGGRQAAAVISRQDPALEDEESTGGLASMGVSALVASYAAYAVAHAMQMAEHSRGGGMLAQLAAVRAELQKRCIIDVLLPLLAHINPFVQVTAAIDLLCSVFEQGDRAVHVLKIAQVGSRGFVPFVAGFALDTYFHAQLAPVPNQILSDATNIFNQLPRSIASFNGLPAPEKTMVWDGHEHTGTVVSITSKGNAPQYYAQHIGMNEYQVYRADQLAMTPQDGERYHIGRDGALRHLSAHTQTRGKL